MRHLVWILAFLFTARGESAFYRPSTAEYAETKALALTVAEQFPTNTHEIIILGRSLVVLGAFLQGLGLPVSTLPISQMNKFDITHFTETELKAIQDRLKPHFDEFIPPTQKKLVFIDFTVGGKAYLKQKHAIESYLKSYRPNSPYEFVAYIWERSAEKIALLKENAVRILPAKGYLWTAVSSSEYEDAAEFGEFIPWIHKKAKRGTEFVEFKALVFKEMQKDPELRCRLVF